MPLHPSPHNGPHRPRGGALPTTLLPQSSLLRGCAPHGPAPAASEVRP